MYQHRLSPFALTVAITVSAVGGGCNSPQSPTKTIKTVTQKGYALTLYDNSETLSQTSALNELGHVIGIRETMNEERTVYTQQYFFSDGTESIDIPILEGFTSTAVAALSDNDRVVGYASRPIGHPDGSLTAIVWEAKSRKLTDLGCFPGDETSHAQDISADGTRITGYTLGAKPARMRPCVWEFHEQEAKWVCEVLDTKEMYNPFLQSGTVVVSPNGDRIAACVTEGFDAAGNIDNALYVWERLEQGWSSRKLSEDYLRLHDMNNEGVIVGDQSAGAHRLPVIVSPEGKFTRIDLLPGDDSGIAHGINANGLVVGLSEDPVGPEGGPQAFLWEEGETRRIEFPAATEYSTALGINDRGQIVGLADFTFVKAHSDELAPASDSSGAAPDSDESQDGPLVKTLGYLRTPGEGSQTSVKTVK